MKNVENLFLVMSFLLGSCKALEQKETPLITETNTPRVTQTYSIPQTEEIKETEITTTHKQEPTLIHTITPTLEEEKDYNQLFLDIIGNGSNCHPLGLENEIGILIYNITDDEILVSIQEDQQMPIASTFKGPLLMYTLLNMDPEIYQTVPVELWDYRKDAPEEYNDFLKENWILNRLYDMIVYSSNSATGDVFYYVDRNTPNDGLNALEQFNEWSREVIGIEDIVVTDYYNEVEFQRHNGSGMDKWNYGRTKGVEDSSFYYRQVELQCKKTSSYSNLYSPNDLAKFYLWLYNDAPENVRRTSFELLSKVVPENQNYLETLAFNLGGQPVSKGGYFGYPGFTNCARADAGLVLLPDGPTYLIVTTSVNSGDLFPEIYEQIEEIIKEQTSTNTMPDF